MTFGRLNCVMLDWFYCCLLPVGNSWHCSLFSIDIHFQQYCFLLDSCTVCASQTEYLPCCPQSLKSTNTKISKICICYLTFSDFPFKLLFWLYFTTNESSIKDTVLPLKVTQIDFWVLNDRIRGCTKSGKPNALICISLASMITSLKEDAQIYIDCHFQSLCWMTLFLV